MATDKPDLNRIWAETAEPSNIIDPDVGEAGKFSLGWLAELPPYEYFNFLQQLFTQGLKHINEQGIPVWDSNTTYPINGWARGSDGLVYQSKVENIGNDPVSSPTQWQSLNETFKSKELKRQIITSSTSWNLPNGVSKVFVDIIGAGGGGAGGDDGNTGGSGANGTNASNTTVSYGSISGTANGGQRGVGVGLATLPNIPTPVPQSGSVSGSPVSSTIISGGGANGGIGGVGQTLADAGGNQGGTGGNGGTGGRVKMELDTTSGGSLNINIGNAGSGGNGNSSNASNNGSNGSPSYVELIWME